MKGRAGAHRDPPIFSLFGELKRRNVFRVAAVYLGTAWLIVHVGTVLGETLETPHWVMRSIMLLLILGFPAVLAFAWAFELTPHGMRRTHATTATRRAVNVITGRKLDILIIVILAAALIFVVLEAYVFDDRPPAAPDHPRPFASIAVLPFTDLSPTKDNEYFSDGISEELLNRLAKLPHLRVTGRTSSFAFRGKDMDLRTIGQQLGVERILQGSVRKQGERLRINAQLIDVGDGSNVWSESYDRQLLDVFAIQDDIAQQVVAAVERAVLDGTPRDSLPQLPGRLTPNLDAYTSYLRGKYLLRSRVGKDMEQSLVEFQRAATLDPRFALAHVGVANALVLLANRHYRNIADIAATADAAIARALELDPQLAEAYAARFLLRSNEGGPRQERLQLISRAIELNPNDPMTLHWAAGDMLETGRPAAEILPLRERAYALDPLAPNVVSVLAAELFGAGQRERALALAEQLTIVAPAASHGIRANMAWMEGRIDGYLRWTARSLQAQPDDPSLLAELAFCYASLGDTKAAERSYQRMRQFAPHSTLPVTSLTMVYLQMGDAPRALALLRTAANHPVDDPDLLRAHALYYSYVGAAEQALNAFRRSDPLLFGDSCEITHPSPYYFTPNVVFVARGSGDMGHASAIATAFFAFTDNWARPVQKGDPDWMRARMAAAMGDRTALIEHLDRLYASGAVLPAWIPVEPLFAPYVHDAEIAERLAKHAERRALWRRQLAAEKL